MKLTQLMHQLQTALDTHGDMRVVVQGYDVECVNVVEDDKNRFIRWIEIDLDGFEETPCPNSSL